MQRVYEENEWGKVSRRIDGEDNIYVNDDNNNENDNENNNENNDENNNKNIDEYIDEYNDENNIENNYEHDGSYAVLEMHQKRNRSICPPKLIPYRNHGETSLAVLRHVTDTSKASHHQPVDHAAPWPHHANDISKASLYRVMQMIPPRLHIANQ